VHQAGDEDGERRKKPDSSREPVHAVDEVEGIGTNQQPEDRRRKTPPILGGDAHHDQHAEARIVCDGGRAELADQLLPRLQPEEVVDNTDVYKRQFNGSPLSGSEISDGGNPAVNLTGQLWRFTASQTPNLNRKFLPTFAFAGYETLIDVSGPASSIGSTSQGSYTYCVTNVAGECYPCLLYTSSAAHVHNPENSR